MRNISESVESWLRDSQNTEFDKKAEKVIRRLEENKQRFNLKDVFNKRDYEKGVGGLVRRLIYVQKMAILPDTLPKEWDETPEGVESMKPVRPIGIEDDEREGIISAIVETLTIAGFGEDIQKLKETSDAFVQKQINFKIKNESLFLYRPAIKDSKGFKAAVLFALRAYKMSYCYSYIGIGRFHPSGGEEEQRRVAYWKGRADSLKEFLTKAHFEKELGAVEKLMRQKGCRT